MTKQEVKDIITTKAAAYGFETKEDTFFHGDMPQIERTMESYIGFQISTMMNHEKTDFKNQVYCVDVSISASVCKMNPRSTPEELLKAADEIRRGALLVKELQEMNLSYIREA